LRKSSENNAKTPCFSFIDFGAIHPASGVIYIPSFPPPTALRGTRFKMELGNWEGSERGIRGWLLDRPQSMH